MLRFQDKELINFLQILSKKRKQVIRNLKAIRRNSTKRLTLHRLESKISKNTINISNLHQNLTFLNHLIHIKNKKIPLLINSNKRSSDTEQEQ